MLLKSLIERFCSRDNQTEISDIWNTVYNPNFYFNCNFLLNGDIITIVLQHFGMETILNNT